jgi:hypothetical protein
MIINNQKIISTQIFILLGKWIVLYYFFTCFYIKVFKVKVFMKSLEENNSGEFLNSLSFNY